MAIDTQAKRQGVLGAHGPVASLPFPDGTVDADDRWVLAGLYQLGADTGAAVVGGSLAAMSPPTKARRSRMALQPPFRRMD